YNSPTRRAEKPKASSAANPPPLAHAADSGRASTSLQKPSVKHGARFKANSHDRARQISQPNHQRRALGAVWRDHQISTPTTAPVASVASNPTQMEGRPRAMISPRRSGTRVPRPPIMMPRLPRLAKPHRP